jgi:hypothetical protein
MLAIIKSKSLASREKIIKGDWTMPACPGRTQRLVAFATVSTLLAGCAQTPLGPTVQVMPGPGRSFEAFQADQSNCKVYAADQVKGQAENANQRAVGAALLTTLLGAGLGAAAGSGWGAAGQGAGIGAGAGAATGAAIGADMSSGEQVGIQVQYDNAYSQCMYAKGEMVPGYAPPSVAAAVPSSYAAAGPDPALVRAVQGELVRLSYLQSSPDGVQGGATRAAIRSYEKANGLAVDGNSSSRLLAKLQATPTGAPAATASAPAGWVAPAQGAAVTPASTSASVSAPAAPSNWVTPVKTP